MSSIEKVLEGKSVCICAGSGGVGKTTTSAAIAAGMAARGKRVAVLTIDPAKRLADSLGLKELGNKPRKVGKSVLAKAGIEGEGELWAMMLDSKATFDDLVSEHAPDDETRERILDNRIYQQLSGALAGSQEYMAMEKLYELASSGEYDLLVLDTPPSRNALDFLEAPNRLLQFIEGRALKVFLRPTGFAAKIAGRGTSVMFSILKRITGVDLLQDLAEFFQAFGGMIGGFRERADRVNELLADKKTTFLVVCGPQSEPIDEATFFQAKLAESKLPFGAAIVNRVHVAEAGGASNEEIEAELAGELGDDELAANVAANFADYATLAKRDRRGIARLRKESKAKIVIEVPELDSDVHDLVGLMEVNRYLFASGAKERADILAGIE
ncbi:ArsA family ATPase [soil metagenome]